jgi:multiple sugar transport system substrate-binding protein
MGVVLGLLALATLACAPARTGLTLSTWGSVEEIATLRGLLTTFAKDHPDIPVELIHIPDNYFQKLHILLATRQTPDVMFLNNLQLPVYAEGDQLLPLEDRLGAEAEAFFPAALEAFRQKGHLLALPRDLSNLVMFYNADAFKAAGLGAPSDRWTMEDFLAASRKLTVDADADGHPERFAVSFDERPLFWLPYVWSFGGELLDADGAVKLDAPASIAGLQFYADLRHRHHVAPTEAEAGNAKMAQLFAQKKIAMFLSGRWSVPAFRKTLDFDWNVAPFPAGPAGSVVDADGSGWAIARTTSRPDDAWTLVRFLAGEHASRQFAESGLILPAREAVAGSKALAGAPSRSGVFFSVLDTARPIHTGPYWGEVTAELELTLAPLWRGQTDAASAARKAAGRLREVTGHD